MGNAALALENEQNVSQIPFSKPERKDRQARRLPPLIDADRIKWIQNIAHKMIRIFRLPIDEYDELLAAGYLGLVEAATRYRSNSPASFKSFAYLRIRGSIIDWIRQNSYLSKRAYQYAKALQAANELREQGFNAGEQDQRASLGKICDFAAEGVLAFQLSYSEEDTVSAFWRQTADAEVLLQQKEKRQILSQALSKLPQKEAQIVDEYYFKGFTFVEIAKRNHLNPPWVSKLHKKALGRLRKALLMYQFD